MPNPYLTDEIADLTRSHKQAMDTMHSTSRQGGEQAVRAISLWQQLVSQLSAEDAQAAGLIVMQRAADRWEEAKPWEVQALDALALSQGKTRQALLDELAAMPETFPAQ